MLSINDFFAPDTGLIQQVKPNFAPRTGQAELSKLIKGAIDSELHIIAEAPTGFGKSFAVLVPAIIQAIQNNKRVVISTETLALQDQYIYNDLPLLQRACQKAGHNFYYATAKGKNNYVCLGGETEILTWDGPRTLSSLAGKYAKIIDGRGQWVESHISCFGNQLLYAITLERHGVKKIIRATAEHRWFTRNNGNHANEKIHERTTLELRPGHRLKTKNNYPIAKMYLRPSPFGVAHGFVFGDGSIFGETTNGFKTATVQLHGEKDRALRPYFSMNHIGIDKLGENYTEDICDRVYDLPQFFKDKPDLDEAPSYLYGWLAGYFAADGRVSLTGTPELNCADKDTLEFVKTLCIRLGIATYPITGVSRLGKGHEPSDLFALRFVGETLSPDFFIIEEHKRRFLARKNIRFGRQQWKVISIEPVGTYPVYCAVVPTTESFVLSDYILTGNCRLKVNEDENSGSKLMKWASGLSINDSGDISDVTFEFEPQDWRKIACDDDCTKKACPFYGAGANVERGETECFVYQARRNYNEASIVVANHTLVLLDAQLGAGTLLGPYDVLIVDEAHSMPERAQDAWGTSLRPQSISKTIIKISTMLGRINRHLPNDNLAYYKDMEHLLFAHFDSIVHKGFSVPMDKVSRSVVEAARSDADLIVSELKKVAKDLNSMLDGEADESPLGQAVASAKESLQSVVGTINKIFGEVDPEFADNWLTFIEVATTPRNGRQAVLHVKPIEVAPLMRGLLIDKVASCIFLSATMKVKGSFTFMRKELGLPFDKTQEFCGESPFDYEQSVVAHCPRNLPSCDRENEEEYLDKIAQECVAIIRKMQGRTMVLFTNATHMKAVYYRVVANVKYQIYLQGTMSKNTLLDQFRENIGSCLFATRSFFTGVDIPGEALSCVVLVKCPFRIPSDPMFAARCAKIKEAGGSDFIDYSLPLMLFDLRQAFGRLIRTVNDRGLFCFLDSRATTKSYWQDIRNSLPCGIRYIQDINRYDGLQSTN